MATWKEGQPQTTARTPHTAHPRIEGTKVSPRARGERFKEFPVVEGELSLLIEPAAVDFVAPSSEIIETLANNAVLLRDTTDLARKATKSKQDADKERDDVRDTITPIVEKIPDLRGLFSVSRDVELTATPTQGTVVFDINKLRESVRAQRRFRKLTSRIVTIEFTPRKDMHPDVLKAIVEEEGLNSLGARVARRASVTTTWLVDDGAVAAMVNSGEITLLPETRRVTEGLSLKAVRLPKRRKNIKKIEAANNSPQAVHGSINPESGTEAQASGDELAPETTESSVNLLAMPRTPFRIGEEDDGYPD